MFQEQLSQALSIPSAPVHGSTIVSGGTATASCGGVDMSKFRRVMFVVDISAVTNGGSVTCTIEEASTVGGSYTTVSNSNITSVTATAVTAASKVVTLEIRADQLGSGKQFVRCKATETGGQNVTVTIIPLAGEANQKPASAQDHTSVTQRLVA